MKYAFAGNRDIAVWVLEFLISKKQFPEFLLLTETDSEEARSMIQLSQLPTDRILVGRPDDSVGQKLKEADLDYIIGIHFPYIIKEALLKAPKWGFLNLHPAFLPYNRGWHTPSWAILEGSPAGATLHFMSEQLDKGDIIHQKKLEIKPNDTANSLYQKLKQLELEVFKEAHEELISMNLTGISQESLTGSSHKKADLFKPEIAELQLSKSYKLGPLMNKLRALTTNDVSEACYFEKDGKKYRVQINIQEE